MKTNGETESTEAEPGPPRRAHRKVGLALIVVASLLSFLAIFAVWADRQLLNTDNWTETSSELIENDAIRTQVAEFMVDELYANVDVQADVEQVLGQVLQPAGASTLAGPAASGLRTLANQGVDRLLGRPIPQQLWENANRRAHKRFLFIVEGGGDAVSTSGGEVTLNLSTLLSQTQSNLGVGGRVQQRLPESAAQIVLFRSSQLELAQNAVSLLKALAIGLVLVALLLFGVAVYLARGWRREALRACGIGLLFAGAAALLARSFAGNAVVNSVATTEAVRPAAEAAWDIGSSLLQQVAKATLIYGVVIVIAAWLAGPTGWAVGARRLAAPYLREPLIAWSAFGVLVLVLLAWAPTPAFRLFVPALLLIALLAAGTEALRRQTMREFPDADRAQSTERLRSLASGLGRRLSPGSTPEPAVAHLDQLERLGRMRDSGLLDASEYTAEKAKVLANSSPAV
ncbi:MAG: SHOCT domain-containing protein [Actinomycetota bacterium]|nr:SHOCT domain-containing protein [Actinomycetota bacterium]